MSRNATDEDSLSELLAEATDREAEEIEAAADEFDIQSPEEADWEHAE
jgi:hypothetical protein